MKSKESYEVIIIVKHGLYRPWIDIVRKGQDASWLAIDLPPEVKVIHFYGKPVKRIGLILDRFHERLRGRNKALNYFLKLLDSIIAWPLKRWVPTTQVAKQLGLKHEEIQCNVKDIYFALKWKQIAIYKYLFDNYDFRYLYETNGSSYVIVNNLLQFSKSLPSNMVYAGFHTWEGAKFISGASRITSRDVIEKIFESRASWDASLLEDVAIGKLCKELNIPQIAVKSIIIESLNEANKLSVDDVKKSFHFRTKSGNLSKRNDAEIMLAIHSKLNNYIVQQTRPKL